MNQGVKYKLLSILAPPTYEYHAHCQVRFKLGSGQVESIVVGSRKLICILPFCDSGDMFMSMPISTMSGSLSFVFVCFQTVRFTCCIYTRLFFPSYDCLSWIMYVYKCLTSCMRACSHFDYSLANSFVPN
jgi:hypothetical protein